ncbi:MAG: hypothetical protein PW845_07990 [Pseudomonas sp.]|uniref:co-regulatory protein PtrA N-terminal domain-containing protein n=1 Tax=Pseudomonas abieticivorans TaxID=2931382 RepID=UPI0020BEABCD|nr:co-regulatory protein PtrA N-terminal domain-containing protein [Pseudomonas sp. PIA16]MDE1165321.1 hypothetical protein [Pseudomonas sp.]
MKALNALLMATLMTGSVAAMASDGGDRVVSNMNAARTLAMTDYNQEHADTQVASHKAAVEAAREGLAVQNVHQ